MRLKIKERNFFDLALSFGVKYFYALFCCIYLFLIGFLSGRNRELIKKICLHFGLIIGNPRLKQISFSELVPANTAVRLIELEQANGNTNLEELADICLIAKHFNLNSIFEIGTFDGRLTINLALNTSAQARIYTLDLPINGKLNCKLPVSQGDKRYIQRRDNIGQRYLNKNSALFPEKAKITQFYADSATFDFSPYLNSMDMVFIDGAHSYDYVINDSKAAFDLLKDGKGIIIWHDYGGIWEGVSQVINEMQSKNRNFKFLHIKGTGLAYLDNRN